MKTDERCAIPCGKPDARLNRKKTNHRRINASYAIRADGIREQYVAGMIFLVKSAMAPSWARRRTRQPPFVKHNSGINFTLHNSYFKLQCPYFTEHAAYHAP